MPNARANTERMHGSFTAVKRMLLHRSICKKASFCASKRTRIVVAVMHTKRKAHCAFIDKKERFAFCDALGGKCIALKAV